MTSPDWEIELFVRVTGRGRIGADGMVCILNLSVS